MTSGGQDWRPVQTCQLEDTPPPPVAIGAHTVGKWALRIALECFLVTARKQSLGQGNMFTGVCLSTGGAVPRPGGGSGPSGGRWGACSGGGVPGGAPSDGYCCGRYASYWNAFLCLRLHQVEHCANGGATSRLSAKYSAD